MIVGLHSKSSPGPNEVINSYNTAKTVHLWAAIKNTDKHCRYRRPILHPCCWHKYDNLFSFALLVLMAWFELLGRLFIGVNYKVQLADLFVISCTSFYYSPYFGNTLARFSLSDNWLTTCLTAVEDTPLPLFRPQRTVSQLAKKLWTDDNS